MSRESDPGNEKHHWELWRQDDNGVRVLVACFDGQSAADRALADFESQHHKQTYWIERKRKIPR